MTKRSLDADLDRLRSDFSALRHDLAETAHALQAMAGERAAAARDTASRGLRMGGGRYAEELDQARSRHRRLVKGVGHAVGGHPFLSIAIAFLVGVLAAAAGGLARRG